MATQGNLVRASTAMGTHPRSAERRVFSTRISAAETRPVLEPTVGSSEAWGTVRIVVNDDDSFEYLATIYNPKGAT